MTLTEAAHAAVKVTLAPTGLTVEAEAEPLSRIVAAIGDAVGFDVYNSLTDDPPISGRWSGAVELVLNRLLRSSTVIIVRQSDRPAGIEKIVLGSGVAKKLDSGKKRHVPTVLGAPTSKAGTD